MQFVQGYRSKGLSESERSGAVGKTVIIGFGNLLMGDDGAGIHLIQKLATQALPPQVELLDGGVSSFAALAELRTATQGILIDAMTGGGTPGDIYRLTTDQLPDQPCAQMLSVHDFSLLDSLQRAKQAGELPPVIIYGIEPAALELGMELSMPAARAVDIVIAKIMTDLDSIIR